jgi:serine/threonine-protein kinase PknG
VSGTTRRRTTTRAVSARFRLGAGLVDFPPIPEIDPATVVVENPVVPEHKRFCSIDGEPVGRSRDGQPGRTEGFCPKCGHPFSFTPALVRGDLVGDGRYEIVGCLAHGGLGWIYLARDHRLERRWVVLKGLLNKTDPDALAAALAERRFLAEVDHEDIVKIYDFVEHGSDGYIVMAYVGGQSLRKMLETHRDEHDGAPLPVDQAIAYVHEILPALGYLHDRGLLFCDFKPDNVMQTGTSLKLIDLGGVYRMDDQESAMYGTRGYQAPEIADTGPTVPSDLFTVGRTLAVLCTNFRGYQTTYEYSLPPAADVPLYTRYDSLYRFLERATARHPDDRFQSATEMADQLFGVLREVVANEKGKPSPGPSTLFTTELRGATDHPDWRALPALLVSTDDPAAGYLATVAASADDPGGLVALGQAPVRTLEVELRMARAFVDAGRFVDADAQLAALAADDEWEWRVGWYRGLRWLASGDPARACEELDSVYRTVPGELAAKLALACAAESAGRLDQAGRLYDIVSRTDDAFTSAAFGLARCRAALDDRDGAVDAYDRVPEASIAYVDAQVAKTRTILAGEGALTVGDVASAGAVVDRLRIGPDLRAELSADVLEAALPLVADGQADSGLTVLGYPMHEDGVRTGLEQTYRALARLAPTGAERIELVDRANEVRPRTLV